MSDPVTPPVDRGEPRDRSEDQVGNQVDVLARTILGVRGVSDLHAGVLGEVATYLPGRRVNGVRLRDPGCDIHVILQWGAAVAATAQAIRTAVRDQVTGPVDVTVEDYARPRGSSPREARRDGNDRGEDR